MKKLFSLMLAFAMIATCVACSGTTNSKGEKNPTPTSSAVVDNTKPTAEPTEKLNENSTSDKDDSIITTDILAETFDISVMDDNTLLIEHLKNKSLTHVVIPSVAKHWISDDIIYPVSTIAIRAFAERESVTSVTIGEGVSAICDFAFVGCVNLEELVLPDSLTYVGYKAFDETKWLDNQLKNSQLVIVNDFLVRASNDVTNVTIPDNINIFCAGAFEGCENLCAIQLPNTITHIEQNTFSGCANLTEIQFPDNITEIGNAAFSNCTGLTSIKIPDSVETINSGAFVKCSNLTEVMLPNKLKVISSALFQNCSALETIDLPNNLKTIESYAFAGCSRIKTITIPDSVTTIESGAFGNCASLETIRLPEGLKSIDWETFSGCTSLKSVVLPSTLTTIPSNAFSGCTSLTEIALPFGLTTIKDYAFYKCKALISIAIPDSVTIIEEDAFYGCDNLTIHCSAGSYAETYAKENGIPYTIME